MFYNLKKIYTMKSKILSETFQMWKDNVITTVKTTEMSYELDVKWQTFKLMKNREVLLAYPEQLKKYLDDVTDKLGMYNEVRDTLQKAKDGLELEWEIPAKITMKEVVANIESLLEEYK